MARPYTLAIGLETGPEDESEKGLKCKQETGQMSPLFAATPAPPMTNIFVMLLFCDFLQPQKGLHFLLHSFILN